MQPVATLIPFTFIITHTRVIVRATNLVFVNRRQRAVVRDGVGGIKGNKCGNTQKERKSL